MSRAARTLPAVVVRDSVIARVPLSAGGLERAARRVGAPAGALARVVVLGGHRRDEPMEARLAGELGVERGGDDVAAGGRRRSGRHRGGPGRPRLRPSALDDRGADEDGVDRRVTEDRDLQLGLERVELAAERVPLDGDVEQRQDRFFAAGDLVRQDDHPGARPEDRSTARGEVEDRCVESPALDELAHRRALATRQDEPADAFEIGRLAHANTLDADVRARALEMPRKAP